MLDQSNVARLPTSAAKPKPGVIVIDSRQLTRECFSTWLGGNLPEMAVAACASVGEAVRHSPPEAGPVSVIFLNIGAGGVSDPMVADDLARLDERLPGVPVIVVSDREEVDAIAEALDYGVRGYVPTSTSLSVVVGAIRLVQTGGTFVPASALMARQNRPRTPFPTPAPDGASQGFTPRQLEVLACLRLGKPNKVIAYELGMCESTVKVHVRHIMKKLRATNRTQVAFLTSTLFQEALAD
ncbi:MAG TPA: response regulator transcription factor [Azospirillaceae bacterium]|nr:response regulator transcription factor [Azospirillaceae bacterium]